MLRQLASPVTDLESPALHELIGDMFDTMEAFDGAGLAATQIGVALRVVIFGVERNVRYPDAPPVPSTVLINPVIESLGTALDTAWEGCLSVPGMRGLVSRPARVRYRGLDPAGNRIDREVDGFHARVVQHECDHLDGILYPERMRDQRSFGFIEELEACGAFDQEIPQLEATSQPRRP
jgi:peptide deformylase